MTAPLVACAVAAFAIYAAAALVSWRLYGALWLLPNLLLTLLWLQHCHAIAQPDHDGGPAEALGVAIVMCLHAVLIVVPPVAAAVVALVRTGLGEGMAGHNRRADQRSR